MQEIDIVIVHCPLSIVHSVGVNTFLTVRPFCILSPMWPFRRKQSRVKRAMRRLVVGMIIGGAIGSIVGKTLLEEREKQKEREDEDGAEREKNND